MKTGNKAITRVDSINEKTYGIKNVLVFNNILKCSNFFNKQNLSCSGRTCNGRELGGLYEYRKGTA